MNDSLMTIISVNIGGIITWLVSWIYYRKAGKELLNEAKELRKLINCDIILQQDEFGQYKPKLDANGNLSTIVGQMYGTSFGNSNTKGNI
ncbi:MAG: LapA family protein [Lutibacter sp.]|nr:LapA family protein [Lutibacter sp.]